ncbi:MAG: kelch-like protein [Myxococcaceae bacterium]|nr:kelch-like protein [Myxococcaceae bacterium]
MSMPRPLSFLAGVLLLALAACTPPPQPQGSAQVFASAQQALSADDVTRVKVTISAQDMATPLSVELSKSNGAWGGLIGNIPVGAHRSFLAEAFDAAGTLRFQGQATGVTITANQTTAVAITLQEVPPPPPYGNEVPVIDSLVASATSVTAGGSLTLTATAHDPNPGDTLTYAWSASSGTFSAPTAASTTWTAPSSAGVRTLTLTVTDSEGAAVSVSLAINVVSGVSTGNAAVNISFNLWPVVSKVSASLNRLDAGQSTSLTATASDADGDALTYQWAATCPGAWTNASASVASFVPSSVPAGACNNCRLTVTVQDGRGGQTTGSVNLCVAASSAQYFPPLVTNFYQSATGISPGQTVNFDVTAMDPQSSAMTFAWTANVGSLATAQNTASTSQIVWTAPSCAQTGLTPTVTAAVTNAHGLSVSKPFSLSGLPTCAAGWAAVAPLISARDNHTATLLPSGKVLVVGGLFNSTKLASAELFDPATSSWSSAGSMAGARSGHTATLLSSGKVLVVGGQGASAPMGELYDPATNSWSPAGSSTLSRYSHTATLLSSGKVLVAVSTSAELYDPATNSWSTASPMISPRLEHTAILLSSGKVLVSGGHHSPNYYASAELYDPATNSWSPAGSMPAFRYQHAAALLPSGKVLVSGGFSTGPSPTASALLYDPASNSWSPAGSMSAFRYNHTAALLSFGKVIVAGGVGQSIDLYDPATNSWSSTSPMITARNNPAAVLLSSGKLLVSGGRNSTTSVTTTEIYSP